MIKCSHISPSWFHHVGHHLLEGLALVDRPGPGEGLWEKMMIDDDEKTRQGPRLASKWLGNLTREDQLCIGKDKACNGKE